LGSEIIDLITDINDLLNGKGIKIIFNTMNSYKYPKYSNELTVMSENEEMFRDFISSLYFIFFESTQDRIKGKGKKKRNCVRYPDEFNKRNNNEPQIIRYIDAIRHKICKAHDIASKYFKPKVTYIDAQYYFINHKNKISDAEYCIIQKKILKELIIFLSDLKKWAEKQN
jgi:hypothetical protein